MKKIIDLNTIFLHKSIVEHFMFKKVILFIIILFSQNILSQEIIYPISTVDNPPQFSECQQFNTFQQQKCFEETIKSHISENIQFPQEAFDSGISGRVLVYFTINSNGEIDEIKSRSPHEILKKEARRLITILPKVSPAKKDNIAVKVSYSLPIDFFLVSRPSSSNIKIFAGSNVYSNTDKKSKIVAVVRNDSRWSASAYGDFWMIDYFTGIGYVSKQDVTVNIDSKDDTRKKNDVVNIFETNFDQNEEIINLNEKEVYVESSSNNLTIDEVENSSKDFIIEKNQDQKEIVEVEEIETVISDTEESMMNQFKNDFEKLDSFTLKADIQEELNRKIPGTNNSDLYYTRALNQFLKILKRELDIKYKIKSYEYPKVFVNTKYEIKNIKVAGNRAKKLKSQNNRLTVSFFNKQFNNPPDNNLSDRLKEIINEIMKLEYTDVESLKYITEEIVVEAKEDNITEEIVVEAKEDNITEEIVVEAKEDNITEEKINKDQKSKNSLVKQTKVVDTENVKNINQELAEVREMLTEMKTLIQKDDLKTPVEEKKIDINDLAKDLIEGKISQADFFSNLKLLEEVKNNNELISSFQNLKTLDEFLNLNILTQSIKMKSELLQSLGNVSNKERSSTKIEENEEINCADFTSFNYSEGRQNIVSSNKFNIVNNSDELSIYPILGSSKSSILVNIKIEGKEMCFDSDSKILISFRDGSSTEILHDSYENCNGETVIFLGRIFGNKAFQDLNELKYKEVEKIRIWMKNSLKELTLSRIQSQELMFTIDCLSSYMN